MKTENETSQISIRDKVQEAISFQPPIINFYCVLSVIYFSVEILGRISSDGYQVFGNNLVVSSFWSFQTRCFDYVLIRLLGGNEDDLEEDELNIEKFRFFF